MHVVYYSISKNLNHSIIYALCGHDIFQLPLTIPYTPEITWAYGYFFTTAGILGNTGRMPNDDIEINTLGPRQNGRHFTDIFKCILNESEWILLKISLKCIPNVQIINIPPFVQIMAWRRPMMVSLLTYMTHVCVTRPQCVKVGNYSAGKARPYETVRGWLHAITVIMFLKPNCSSF